MVLPVHVTTTHNMRGSCKQLVAVCSIKHPSETHETLEPQAVGDRLHQCMGNSASSELLVLESMDKLCLTVGNKVAPTNLLLMQQHVSSSNQHRSAQLQPSCHLVRFCAPTSHPSHSHTFSITISVAGRSVPGEGKLQDVRL